MTHTLVVTFVGPDRVGIVQRLSKLVASRGGNWEEGRMACLAGRFAGILKVTVEPAQAGALVAALRGLEAEELSVFVDDIGVFESQTLGDRSRLRLELTSLDHQGIVSEISAVLASHRINILDLTSERFEAPMSGDAMFRAVVELERPTDVSLEQLEDELRALALDVVVQIELSESG
ncbi:MAG: hypothetical protein KC609_15325 [Myxococcales bacterium]|nr:hypothetical protein [Myxococcales bacterium]